MKKMLTGLTTILFVSSLLTGCMGNNQQPEVTTTIAKSGANLSNMVWQGTVAALSSIDVVPNGNGKITEIPVKEGDRVEAGAVLFQVDSQNAWLQLEQAKASYQAAEAAFASAEKTSQQNTSVRPAEIAYSTARDNFSRIQALFTSGAVSQADYDNAKAQMDSASSQLQAARNGQSGGYDTTKAQLDGAKAAVDIVQKQYDDCTVTSPISGTISKVDIEVGQMVSPTIKAVTVIDDSGKKVELQVADMDINQLQIGLPVNVSIQSLAETCQGEISDISVVSDEKTGMFTVKVSLAEDSDISYIGLIADIRIADHEASDSVYIPAKCVQSDEDGTFVYQVVDDQVIKTAVSQGNKKNAYYEITEGLVKGNEIVLQTSKPLEDNMKVRVLTVK